MDDYAAYEEIEIRDADIKRLEKEKAELRAALQHLLAKPRCGRCRKAVQTLLDRIK